MPNTWIYFVNFILTSTKGSFGKAYEVSCFHDNALFANSSDPDILALYNAYHPFHLALEIAYLKWKSQGGDRSGKTFSLNHLLDVLSGIKISNWDIAIQNVYNKRTIQYNTLFPNGRAPFQHGKQLEIITAIQTLSDTIGTDPALANVKLDIDTFHTSIYTTYNNQKASKSNVAIDSDNLEIARVKMCEEQFGNYGFIIYKYKANPELGEAYFDKARIRPSHQVHFTGHLNPETFHQICKHTFYENDEVNIYNPGPGPLNFYLAQHKDELPTAEAFTIAAGAEQTIFATSLGNLAYKQFMVYNPDTNLTGEFIVDFM